MSKRERLRILAEERAELLAENRRLRAESRRLLCLLSGHDPDDAGWEPPVALVLGNPAVGKEG